MEKRKILAGIVLLFLLFSLPLAVYLVQQRQELRKKAVGLPGVVSDIALAVYCHNHLAIPFGDSCPFSALAQDANSRFIWQGVTYEWGISSQNSIGTLSSISGPVTTLTAKNEGQGDLWVSAYQEVGMRAYRVDKSIKVNVGFAPPIPTPAAGCLREGNNVHVTPPTDPGNCHDIQEAIDVAQEGDNVLLASGTYPIQTTNLVSGNYKVGFVVKNKRINLLAEEIVIWDSLKKGLDPKVAIARKENLDFIIAFENSKNSSIKGLYLDNAERGSVLVSQSKVEISLNKIWDSAGGDSNIQIQEDSSGTIISQNIINAYIRGIWALSTNQIIIADNIIDDCDKSDPEFESAGIYITNSTSFNIERNTIESCLVGGVTIKSSYGGWINNNTISKHNINSIYIGHGIEIEDTPFVNINSNLIFDNEAPGVRIKDSPDFIFARNIIHNIRKASAFSVVDSSGRVEHNTIVRNEHDGIDLVLYSGRDPAQYSMNISSNIIAENDIGITSTGYDLTSPPNSFSHNDVWGNKTTNYSGLEDLTGKNGNISEDPKFGPDYCLLDTSPCLGTGMGETDMGAIGKCSACPNFSKGDANCDNKVDELDYVVWWQNYGTGVGADFNGDGFTDELDYVIWWSYYGNSW